MRSALPLGGEGPSPKSRSSACLTGPPSRKRPPPSNPLHQAAPPLVRLAQGQGSKGAGPCRAGRSGYPLGTSVAAFSTALPALLDLRRHLSPRAGAHRGRAAAATGTTPGAQARAGPPWPRGKSLRELPVYPLWLQRHGLLHTFAPAPSFSLAARGATRIEVPRVVASPRCSLAARISGQANREQPW